MIHVYFPKWNKEDEKQIRKRSYQFKDKVEKISIQAFALSIFGIGWLLSMVAFSIYHLTCNIYGVKNIVGHAQRVRFGSAQSRKIFCVSIALIVVVAVVATTIIDHRFDEHIPKHTDSYIWFKHNIINHNIYSHFIAYIFACFGVSGYSCTHSSVV